jgi:hypothetical protein
MVNYQPITIQNEKQLDHLETNGKSDLKCLSVIKKHKLTFWHQCVIT